MTSLARTSLTSFTRGHEFSAALFTLSKEEIAAYLAAVGDLNDYGATVPPLAAVALGLDALQRTIELPEGSLHTGQEVEQMKALTVDEPLTMTGRIAQRSERQGFVVCVIEFEVTGAAGASIRARSTIMAPGAAL